MISNILSTDNALHMNMVKKITNKFKELGDEYILQESKGFVPFCKGYFYLDKPKEDIADIQGLMVHACDLFGPVMPFEIASTWSKKLATEFTK